MTKQVALRAKRKRSGSVRSSHQDIHQAAAAAIEPLERRVMLSGNPAWLAAGSAATWNSSTDTLTVTGSATIVADPGSDEPNVIASGSAAQLTITPSISDVDIHIGGITLTDGASIVMSSVGSARSESYHNVLVLGALGAVNDPTLSIDSSSKLDLMDNDLIVHTGSSDDGDGTADALMGVVPTNEFATVAALAAEGRNVAPGGIYNGTWTGNGLTSSSAAGTDSSAGDEEMILAVAQNNDMYLGGYRAWAVGSASETLGLKDIIVKYTYNADLNLDGAVDGNAGDIFSTFFDNGVSSGDTYAEGDLNGDGQIDGSDATIFDTMYGLGLPPSGLVATSTTNSSVSLSWNDPYGFASGYDILRQDPGDGSYQEIGTADTTTFTDTSAGADTVYSYEVESIEPAGPTSATMPVSAQTLTDPWGGYDLLWNYDQSPQNADAYDPNATGGVELGVQFSSDQSGYVTGIQFYKGTEDTDSHTAELWNVSGDLLATATFTNESASGWQEADFSAPVLIAAGTPYVVGYHTDAAYYTDDAGYFDSAYNNTPLHVAASEGGLYAYGSSAFPANSTGNANNYWVQPVFEPVILATVTGLTASSVTQDSVSLSWSSLEGAATYNVLRMGPGDQAYVTVGSGIVDPTFTDTTVSAGSTYSYEVVAVNGSGDGPASAAFSVATLAPAPSAPSGLTATANSSTQITLSWIASSGTVTAYHIERSTDGVNFTEINSDVQGTTYTDKGLQPNTSYTYRVRAENDGSFSGYDTLSEPVSTLAATAPAMPAQLTAVPSVNGIALQWSANTEGDLAGYNVLRGSSASGPFTQLNTQLLTAPAYDDTTAPTGVICYYQVQAVDTSMLVSAAATANATRPASVSSTPQNLTATQVSAAGVLLTWTGPQGVTYTVYRDDQPIASDVQSAGYLDSTAAVGITYSYTVSSTDASGNTSPQSTSISVTIPAGSSSYDSSPPSAPTNLTATPDQGSPDSEIDLSWSESSDDVAEYEILRNGVQVGVTSSTSFVDKGLTPGSYSYGVIAFDANDNQSPAATVPGSTGSDQTAPNPPIDLQGTAVTQTSIVLSWVQPWDNVGVTSYHIVRYGPATVDLGIVRGATTFTDSGLAAGTYYWYNVTALDAAGNQSIPTTISVATPSYSPNNPVSGQESFDYAEDQYIPPVWQEYFYGSLVSAAFQTRIIPNGNAAIAGFANNQFLVDYGGSIVPAIGGQLAYRDLADDNGYDPGVDPLWYDVNGNGVYDAGEPIIENSTSSPLQPGQFGKTNGLYYLDIHGDGTWQSDDPLWYGPDLADPDARNFRYDFSTLYTSIEQAVLDPYSPIWEDQTTWTMPELLEQLGDPLVDGSGTISVSQTTGAITGTGTHFETQVHAGDQIVVGSSSFCVAEVESDTLLEVWADPRNPSSTAINGAAYQTIGWTLVPNTAATINDPAFSYAAGAPGDTEAVFPQQFQELRSALMLLFPALQIAPVPNAPLPLTSEMDYLNVIPDSNLDGIVQTPVDLTTFASATGVMTLLPQDSMPQTYIPIQNVDVLGMPVHEYFLQGAFGETSTSVGSLLAPLDDPDTVAYPDYGIDENPYGLPFGLSTDTHLVTSLWIDDGSNHVKRIEAIRPGGNAVTFNFAWNSASGSYSPIGTPLGWNDRDIDRTYVLRDSYVYSSGTDVEYDLMFASGIVQTFLAGSFGYDALLWGVWDENTGVGAEGDSRIRAWISEDELDGDSFSIVSAAGNTIQLLWNDGTIAAVEFTSSESDEDIETQIGYDPATSDIVSMQKFDGDQPIPEYSFAYADGILSQDDVTITRTGSVADGQATIETDMPSSADFSSGTSTTEVYTFNTYGLITTDAVTLNEGGDGPSTTSTTSYQYQEGTGRYSNGAPIWSKVVLVTYPDQSWMGFVYDSTTGWVTSQITPFESSTWQPGGSTNDDRVEAYDYNASDSGNGEGADPAQLVQQPRVVTDYVEGQEVGQTFYSYGAPQDYPGMTNESETVVTRQSGTLGLGWAEAEVVSTTTTYGPDWIQMGSIRGNADDYIGGIPGEPIYYDYNYWMGQTQPVSQSEVADDAFGDVNYETIAQIGAAFLGNSSSSQEDSFGRPLTQTLAGGQTVTDDYTNSDGTTNFFGPASVVETDGTTTDYTYTPLGQVASEVQYAGTSYSIQTSYVYDAAGNVVKQTETPVDSSGNPDGAPLVTTYEYDAQGRLLQEVDNAGGSDSTANQTTTNVYSFDGTYNIVTTTNPDGSTNITKTYLDGTTASDGGNDQTPDSDSEGVVSGNITDANGNIETAGSTWVMASSDGGQDWTKTFTNVLGEVYLVQQSDPTSSASPGQSDAYSDAVTIYNLNEQAVEQIGTDGTAVYTIYNPSTGQPGATWTDVAGTGTFDPGVDPWTVIQDSALATSPSAQGGDNTDQLSTDGSQDDNSESWDGGLDSSDTEDGMTTTTVQSLPSGPGDYTVTTTNPDGTQTVDTYSDDLLMQEQQLGSTGAVIATTSYTYNDMRELATETDSTGTTTYSYYQDGTQDTETDPGQPAETDDTPDPQAGQAQTTTLPDGTTQSDTYDDQGNTISQSGDGQLAATYGYDENGTGELTSLTTSAGTTHWAYDEATGELQSETFADGTQDTYQYNDKGELASESEPGMTGNFGYDDAGDLLRSSYYDSQTGLVQSVVTQQDDQGRPIVTTDTDNGQSFTETDAYDSLGDLQSETFGSAGNTTVSYGYYAAGTTAGSNGGDSDALASLTASTPGGQSVSQSYTYDSAGRLASITVNGITINYSYAPNSDQVDGINAGPGGSNGLDLGVDENYSPDSADGSRLGSISVQATSDAGHGDTDTQTVTDSYTYNNDDQIASDQISQADSNSGNTTSQTLTYTYDPNESDALTQVTDGNGNVLYNYAYDGTGNFTGNTSLGTANNVDEYSNFTYNARHDLTNDGTDAYGYDALDRLISITPDSPTTGSLSAQYGYDDQGRMTWENVYSYSGTAWGLYTTYHYVWSGDELIEKLDANNDVLQQYTWGPSWDGQDQVIALTDCTQSSPTTYLLSYDASGNVTMLLNPVTGTVAATYTYTPYGALVSASGPEADINPFLGKGYWTDAAVDSNLGWAQPDTTDGNTRETNFSTGIWMQDDPTGFNGGLNPTSVDGDDPINNIDPDGTRYFPGWSAETSAELGDLDTLERQWSSKDWNVAADMLDHFLNGNGTVLRTLPQKDIDQIKTDPDELVKDEIISDINDRYLSTDIDSVTGLLHVSSNKTLGVRWSYFFGNPNLFYGFGSVAIQYDGTYNVSDRTLTLSVTLLKHYNFTVDHLYHYLGWVRDVNWRNAHDLQAKGVAEAFNMRLTFNWTINDVLPPPYTHN